MNVSKDVGPRHVVPWELAFDELDKSIIDYLNTQGTAKERQLIDKFRLSTGVIKYRLNVLGALGYVQSVRLERKHVAFMLRA